MFDTGKPSKVLLIVDNSLLITERLITILKEVKSVKKFLTATDYTATVKVLYENKTDIVLLDIQLPGKNGIEVLKFIVTNYPGTKVIMLSNLVSGYYQKLCKKAGAVDFIDKSKDFDLIPEILAAL